MIKRYQLLNFSKKKKKREYIRITYMFPKQQDNLVMFVQQFSF